MQRSGRSKSDQFILRMNAFAWPSCVQKLTHNWNPKESVGSQVKFEVFRQVALATNYCLQGLVSDEIYQHWLDVQFLFAVDLMPGGVLDGDLQRLVNIAEKIVEDGKRLFPHVWKKPSYAHSLVELIKVCVPALRNINLANTNGFERILHLTESGSL